MGLMAFGAATAGEGGTRNAVRSLRNPQAPNKAPTAAVIPMASAPQNVTRVAPGRAPAPPTRAATAPRIARKARDVPDTHTITAAAGAMAVVASGRSAPTAKASGGRQRRLDRSGRIGRGEPEFVARVGAEGIVTGELLRDLACKGGLDPPGDVDGCQFALLRDRVLRKFRAFARQVRLLGVGLGMD
jgi:hypothetical protein